MVGNVSASDQLVGSVVKLAQRRNFDGHCAIEDNEIRDRLVQMQGFLEAQRYSTLLQFSKGLKNEPLGILPMLNKLGNTNLGHRVADLALELLDSTSLLAGYPTRPMSPSLAGATPASASSASEEGDRRRLGDERFMNQFFGSLGMAIAGGTSNIQRNIIAERGLGLPKDTTGSRS